MELKVLGSSSKGNCYLIGNEEERLIIECGFSYKKILGFLNYNLKNVVGCLITHEHGDHSAAVDKLAKNGIDIYSSKGTLDALKMEGHRFNVLLPGEQVKIGGFTIMPFQTEHDCKEPIGFLIYHELIGKLLFATDTFYLRYKFKGLNHILIECNYEDGILEENVQKGIINEGRKERTERSHFSLENVKDFFRANELNDLKTIVLLHLSPDNSDPVMFENEIAGVTGKEVYIAKEGFDICL